ncbi:PfkB family carbohydrate kinase [Shigella flexneri]
MLTTFLIFNLFLLQVQTVTGNHYQVAFGGKGANQVVAAGRVAVRISRLLPALAMTASGESVRQQLATDNIVISPVSVIQGESRGAALVSLMAKVRCHRYSCRR